MHTYLKKSRGVQDCTLHKRHNIYHASLYFIFSLFSKQPTPSISPKKEYNPAVNHKIFVFVYAGSWEKIRYKSDFYLVVNRTWRPFKFGMAPFKIDVCCTVAPVL